MLINNGNQTLAIFGNGLLRVNGVKGELTIEDESREECVSCSVLTIRKTNEALPIGQEGEPLSYANEIFDKADITLVFLNKESAQVVLKCMNLIVEQFDEE